jgi:PAS domain S-box-containing protein
MTITAQHDPEGRVLWLDGIVEDITRRREAERLLQRQQRLLDALHETAVGLVNRLELSDLLNSIVARATELMSTPHGWLALVDAGSGELRCKVGMGLYRDWLDFRFRPGEGVSGKVWLSGQSLVVEDYARLPRAIKRLETQVAAVVGLPLITGGEVVGVLGVARRRGEPAFSREEVMVLGRLAELAAVALDNARLYSGLQQELAERLRWEKALRQREQHYRTIFNHASNALLVLETDGTIVDVNRAACQLFGYRRQELLGRPARRLLAPERRRDPLRLLRELEHQSEARMESQGRRKDGTVFPAAIALTRLPVGEKGQLLASIRDVTRQHLVEEQRRELEMAREMFEAVFQHHPHPLLLCRLEGTILAVNRAFERVWGYRAEEVVGTSARRLYANPASRDEMLAVLEQQGRVEEFATVGVKGNGQRAPCVLSVEKLDVRGQPHIIVTALDVTERRRLEAQLRQSQKMEAIGTLAGGIAHDFNNILTAMVGYTEMALTHLPSNHPARHDLGQVLKAGDRARELVQQILSFSRPSEHERKPLLLGPVIKEALKLLRASLPATIEIQQELSATEGTVLADPTQIHQLLMNLCANAAHAMRRRGGVLTVRLERVELDARAAATFPDLEPGAYHCLSVADTGVGMDEATLERIFEPFFTTKAPGEGTGMGLSVVHGIVKAHQGAITVSSRPGQGTTFRIYFPLLDDQAPAEPLPQARELPHGQERILVVDDEEPLLSLVTRMLEMLGYRVTGRSSGAEALARFKMDPHAFDLVITDLIMPRMTGLDLAREIKALRPELPIILCTGFSEQMSRERARELGIARLLRKPMVLVEVARTVREVLDQAAGRV